MGKVRNVPRGAISPILLVAVYLLASTCMNNILREGSMDDLQIIICEAYLDMPGTNEVPLERCGRLMNVFYIPTVMCSSIMIFKGPPQSTPLPIPNLMTFP